MRDLRYHTTESKMDAAGTKNTGICSRWSIAQVEDGVGGNKSVWMLVLLTVLLILNQAHRQLYAVLMPGGMQCPNSTGANATPSMPAENINSMNYLWNYAGTNANASDDTDCMPITEAQQGTLIGPCFTIPFLVGGFPLSILADKYRRTSVLALGVAMWSATIIASSWSRSIMELVVFRVALGTFQASLNPCVYALLSDYFPASRRSTVFGLYHLGVYVGIGLSYTSGALNHYVGWRNCLRIWGGPGILLAGLAIFFLKEPARGLSDKPERRAMNSQHPPEAAAPASLGAMLRRAWNTKSYILLCVAASVTMFARFALAAWLAPFYQDHFEQDAVKYGPIIGMIIVFGGGASAVMGGWLADRYNKSPKNRAYIMMLSQFVPLPLWIGTFAVGDVSTSYAMLFFAVLTGDAYLGVAAATVQTVMPPSMRARASLLYLASNTLVGGCGPLAVGFALHHTDAAIPKVMIAVVAAGFSVSGFLFYWLSFLLEGDARRAELASIANENDRDADVNGGARGSCSNGGDGEDTDGEDVNLLN